MKRTVKASPQYRGANVAIHAPLRPGSTDQETVSGRSESRSSSVGRTEWRLIAATAAVCLAGAAFTLALIGTMTATQLNERTVEVVPAAPGSFAPERVATAKLQACASWKTAATVMAKASNAVADLPPGWNTPERMAARSAESKVVLSQTAFLRTRLDDATPPEIKEAIERYNALSIAQQDAAIHRQGSTEDSLIDDQNAVGDQIKSACGLS